MPNSSTGILRSFGELAVKKVDGQDRPVIDVDGDLVDRVQQGDLDAFRELFEKYQQRVRAIAFGIVGNMGDAEDVAQEAFLKVYEKIHNFRRQSSFYTWLYRIVFNLSIDFTRKRNRREETSVGDSFAIEYSGNNTSNQQDYTVNTPRTPEEELGRAETRREIQFAVDSLTPQHRAVIILREIEGLSYEDISKVVKVSKGTVMSRLHHARKKLQQVINDLREQGFPMPSKQEIRKSITSFKNTASENGKTLIDEKNLENITLDRH